MKRRCLNGIFSHLYSAARVKDISLARADAPPASSNTFRMMGSRFVMSDT